MPCYTINTVDVPLGTLSLDLAEKALADMGLNPRRAGLIIGHRAGQYDRETGTATWRGQDRTAELKRAYSAQVIKSQAARFGWTLRQSKTDKYTFTVAKR